jgi:xanthine dehydrogenase small subunit
VGLWVTKQMRELGDIVYIGRVEELRAMQVQDGMLEIGAGVSLEEAYAEAARHYPQELSELWQRFASLPVRNAGTLGGNVANGSPIGDSMPWLIALGTQIVLASVRGQRVMPLEDFYLAYQKSALQAGEVVQAVRMPLPRKDVRFRAYKLSKRFDQDISAVCAAFACAWTATPSPRRASPSAAWPPRPSAPPTPKRCCKAALERSASAAAMAALAQDYAPLSDMRASAAYRLRTAQNLLYRFGWKRAPMRPWHARMCAPSRSAPREALGPNQQENRMNKQTEQFLNTLVQPPRTGPQWASRIRMNRRSCT